MGQITDLDSLSAFADGDLLLVRDVSDATNKDKKGLWSLVKSTLKTYFDTLYPTASSGTWTPVVADASTGGTTATVTTSSGTYTKNGKMVHATCWLVGISTAGLTSGAAIHVRDLPFTTSSATNYRATAVVQASGITYTGTLVAWLGGSRTYVRFAEVPSGGAAAEILVSDAASGSTNLIFSIMYATD